MTGIFEYDCCLIVGTVFLVALAAAFVVLLTKKWGIAEWMQVHGSPFVSKLFSCDLCMSFWAGVCISVFVGCWCGDARLFLLPVFTTPITRMLV